MENLNSMNLFEINDDDNNDNNNDENNNENSDDDIYNYDNSYVINHNLSFNGSNNSNNNDKTSYSDESCYDNSSEENYEILHKSSCDICFEDDINIVKTICGCKTQYCSNCISKMSNDCCVCKNPLVKNPLVKSYINSNIYSFALHPEKYQPSGSMNCSYCYSYCGGGIMSLIAFGAQDVYLQGSSGFRYSN
jgi:hypothetical protein